MRIVSVIAAATLLGGCKTTAPAGPASEPAGTPRVASTSVPMDVNVAPGAAETPRPERDEARGKALNDEGMEHYRARRLADAVKSFEGAIQADPQSALAHYNLACTLSLQVKEDPCADIDDATIVRHLGAAVELGGAERRKRLPVDEDLAALRELFPFRLLLQEDPLSLAESVAPALRGSTLFTEGFLAGGGSTFRFDSKGVHWAGRIYEADPKGPNGMPVGRAVDQHGDWVVEDDRVELIFSDDERGWFALDKGARAFVRMDSDNNGDLPKRLNLYPSRDCSS